MAAVSLLRPPPGFLGRSLGLAAGCGLLQRATPGPHTLSSAVSLFGLRAASSIPLNKPIGRDPERPKRTLTPWIRFLARFRQENETITGNKVMSVATVQWKAMSEQEKRPFEYAYEAERSKYKEQMEAYVSSGKKEAWARDPNRPKRPLTPFFKFALEYRAKNPRLKATESVKTAKQTWDGLSEAEKAPYVKLYEQESQQYKEAMEKYKTSGKAQEWQSKVGITQLLEKEQAKAAKVKAKELALKAKGKATAATQKQKAMAAKQKEKAMVAKQKQKETTKQKALAAAKRRAAASKAATIRKAKEKAAKQKAAAARAKERAAATRERARLALAKKKVMEAARRAAAREKRREKQKAAAAATKAMRLAAKTNARSRTRSG